jgi:hypothetical protein
LGALVQDFEGAELQFTGLERVGRAVDAGFHEVSIVVDAPVEGNFVLDADWDQWRGRVLEDGVLSLEN